MTLWSNTGRLLENADLIMHGLQPEDRKIHGAINDWPLQKQTGQIIATAILDQLILLLLP